MMPKTLLMEEILAVTGWKSVFVNRGFTRRINGVTKDESDMLLQYLFNVSFLFVLWLQNLYFTFLDNWHVWQLVTQNHDAQVRFKWSKDDLAIWDNRSTWHTATYDYAEARAGDRVCSLGEAPYFDPQSKSRREALGEQTFKFLGQTIENWLDCSSLTLHDKTISTHTIRFNLSATHILGSPSST